MWSLTRFNLTVMIGRLPDGTTGDLLAYYAARWKETQAQKSTQQTSSTAKPMPIGMPHSTRF
jgi:hypothetical protein